MISETLNTTKLIDGIQGNLTVELRNAATDKIEERVEAQNFISMAGVRHLKWVQRANYFKDGISTLNAGADIDYAIPNPHNHLVLTSLTDATNASSEWHMHGKLAGYAGKYSYTGACNLLGSPNTTLSEATPTYAKWVFDWQTQAGNGTIGSIGWMNAASTFRGTITLPGRYYTSCTIQDTKNTSNYYTRIARVNDTQYFCALSGVPTVVVTDADFAEISNFSIGTQFKASTTLTGIAWDNGGNKLWVLGINTSNAPIIASYNVAGNLIDAPTTITNRSYAGLAFDGSDLWTISTVSDNTFSLNRISTNGSDLSSSTINLPTHNYQGTGLGEIAYGIAYEASRQLIYTTTHAYHIQSSSWKAGGGSSVDSPYATSAIRAFTTSGEEAMVPTSLLAYTINSGASYWLNSINGTYTTNDLDFEMIDPYQVLFLDRKSSTSYVRRLLLDGMGSRALLPSPITKTDTQTMRITYQMDYT